MSDFKNIKFKKVFHCKICNNTCGTIELYNIPQKNDTRESLYFMMDIKGFTQQANFRLKASEFDNLIKQYSENQLQSIYLIDKEFIPFYCPECNENYCKDHWNRWTTFDEGYYDAEFGICPNGHKRKLFD